MIKKRIVLYIYEDKLPAWLVLCLEKLSLHNGVHLAGVIYQKKKQSKPHKASQILYRLYRKTENKFSKPTPSAFTGKAWPDFLQKLPRADEQDIQTILSWQPDCILNCSSKLIEKDIMAIPAQGVWHFGPGNLFNAQASSAVSHAVVQGHCSTPVCLMAEYSDSEKKDILYLSYSATQPFINKNLNLACWKAASFVSRVISLWQHTGQLQKINNPTLLSNDYFKAPDNIKMLAFLGKRCKDEIKRRWVKRSYFQQWLLLHHFSENNVLETDFSSYHSVYAPKSAFWADPAVFLKDGTRYIFFEEYLYARKKAHISVISIGADNQPTEPRCVLDKPYHLSYPFIFEQNGDIYMIPETSANKTIELYKAVSFPNEWQLEKVLMTNVHAVDSTLLYANNTWWLFTNIKENAGASAWDELFIFYAPHFLTDQWTPHSLNPVVSDVRTARPAGNFFESNGKIYRPSQDCSCTYGYAININEISILSEEDYQEKLIEKKLPDWNENVKAIHTFSSQDGFVAIDARKLVPKKR
jgi:hypothetical protein